MAPVHSPVRIGVDVGGTNTDAVILDPAQQAAPDRGVLAFHKTPTTRDATAGIETALRAVLAAAQIELSRISSITIGTTAFLNAVIERDRRRLQRVGVLRLSQSFLRDIKPLSDWPPSLAAIVRGYVGYVDGGLHIDGSEEAPVVEAQVVRECAEFRARGLTTIVVAGVYAPIDQEFQQEDRVRDIIRRELPGADVVCSHEVANIGFLERENAAILNAAILRFARQTLQQFQNALGRVGLEKIPLYLTQNDGTVLNVAAAAQVPIRTFSSGVTNSMHGAAYLSGLAHNGGNGQAAIVVDMGGTTTDIGYLLPSGLPRPAATYVSVGGVKVNYPLPHLHSIGLGGGSLVRLSEPGHAVVGPASVGSELERSLVFGGDTTTATDIAVAARRARIGPAADAAASIDKELVDSVLSRVGVMLEQAIDAVKTSPQPLPVLLTGGGSILAPDIIAGASEVIRPPFYDVANAVGAACSRVGATVDIIHSTSDKTAAEVAEEVKKRAIDQAVAQGALRDTVYIAQVDAIPIPYLDNRVRSIVTAIGDLDMGAASAVAQNLTVDSADASHTVYDYEAGLEHDQQDASEAASSAGDEEGVNLEMYAPTIVRDNGKGVSEWHLNKTDIDFIADGCYLLGCGGGGNPEAGRLQLRDLLDAGHTIRVVDVASVADDARVYWGGRMGSPAAIAERLQAHETVLAIRALMDYLRHDDFDAVMGLEIGGSNGLEPLLWGSSRFFDRPVLDGDFMGRANPMCWQTTLTVHQPGHFCPCAVDSGTGRTILMTRAPRDEDVDRPLRGAIAELGSLVGLAPAPTTGAAARQFAVLHSVSLAWRLGRAMAQAAARHDAARAADTVIRALGGAASARVLFRGKITAIERTLRKGLSVGVLHLAETHEENEGDGAENGGVLPAVATGGSLRIPFVNENILAEHVRDDGTSSVIATVPDLITLLDRDTGKAVGVPEYRYGCHVVVLGMACSPRWTDTARGIEIGGPQGYGYDLPYQPLGSFQEPRSVIEEFAGHLL